MARKYKARKTRRGKGGLYRPVAGGIAGGTAMNYTTRFYKLARSLCPNHFTVKQFVSQFQVQTGIATAGAAGNYNMVFNQAAVSPAGAAIAFTLQDIPGYQQFTTLFDRYRIRQVLIKMRPTLINADIAADQTLRNLPITLYVTKDLDDATSPASTDVIREYQDSINPNPYRSFSYSFSPRVALAAYAGGVFTSFANTASYIDCNSPAVQHYGFKMVCSAGTALYLQQWVIEAEYIIDFKNVR